MRVRPCPTSSLLCSIALALLALTGCAGDSDAVEKRLGQMREDIRKLQNDNDRLGERLEAVELRQARSDAAASAPMAQSAPSTVSRPRLKVLHLAPGDAADAPADKPGGSEETAPRMILRGQGKELEIKQGAGG